MSKEAEGAERCVPRLKFIISDMLKPGAFLNLKHIRLANFFCLFHKLYAYQSCLINIYWTFRIFLVVFLIPGVLNQVRFVSTFRLIVSSEEKSEGHGRKNDGCFLGQGAVGTLRR